VNICRRWWWVLLLIPLGLGAARLRLDVEVLDLLPQHLPIVQGLKIYQENFSNARELIITLESGDANELEAAARSLAETLRRQTNLVSQVTWQPAWLEYPGQSAELIAYLWFNQPPHVFASLTDRLAGPGLTNALLEAQQRLATSFTPGEIATLAYDPLQLTRLPNRNGANEIGTGDQLFVSGDGTFRVLFVEANSRLGNYKQCRAWLDQIKEIVERLSLPGPVKVSYTGRPAFVTEIAGGMEKDITGSAGGTLLTIGILFYLTHRRMRPLLWLLALLLILLVATTAVGGLFFGTLNVISMGFASILLGLSEDFGIVLYQESRSHPELTTQAVRRLAAPGIWWSAITTAGAFLLLNLSGLPGLGQLGSLVAIGILLAAVVMIYVYVPPLMRWHRKSDPLGEKFMLFAPVRLLSPRAIWLITIALLAGAAFVVAQPRSRFDRSPNALKPKNSRAYAAVEEIKQRLGRPDEPVWVMARGKDEQEVAAGLSAVEPWLEGGISNRFISRFTLPTSLWPNAQNQNANRATLHAVVARANEVRAAITAHGFTTNSLGLTASLFGAWRDMAVREDVYWPSNSASRWVLNKIVGKTSDGILALGLIYPAEDHSATRRFMNTLPQELQQKGIIVSSWEFLGPTIFEMVTKEFPRVLVPIILLVLVSLWLAFRSFRSVLLSIVTLAFSGLALQAIMDLAGWRWNLLNLMAVPLLLGMGVDYGIHIQLALRRHEGDLAAVRKSVGRALLLAGATTVVGFGSLGFSTNAGMASLGVVCAVGIGLALFIAVYLLPVWWRKFH
jgi:uncharacterized protein